MVVHLVMFVCMVVMPDFLVTEGGVVAGVYVCYFESVKNLVDKSKAFFQILDQFMLGSFVVLF